MKYILLTVCVIFALQAYSQEGSNLENYSEGQYFFQREEYLDAIHMFKRVLELNPDNANLSFKIGESYLNVPGQEHLAIPYLEAAAESIVPKREYNGKSFQETNAPLHALFFLGNAYRANGELDKALSAYKKFMDSPHFYGNYNIGVVEKEMKSCERAKIIQDAPVEFEQIQLCSAINTESDELNPVISGDGKTLVFIRKLKFYDAIFYSQKVNGEWQMPINLNPEIGSDGEYYPTSLNYDGSKLLLTRKGAHADIYVSELVEGKWGKAMEIPGKINSLANEEMACFTPDGQQIIFASDRRSSKGGFDLFYSDLDSQEKWSSPKNMGKEINSELDEVSPYMSPNGTTLFFSSKSHYNMGGHDIFFTNKIDKKTWSTPLNIGYPINTTRDDVNYNASYSPRQVYYSIRDEKSVGGSDIYLIIYHSNLAEVDE